MNKASPVEMRKALEMVNALKMAGILFVPMPVLDHADHADLVEQATTKLNQIEVMCERV
jgi:hypothetical protein